MTKQVLQQSSPVDRSEAVNLARNMLEVHECKGITDSGVRVLCEAVMAMDSVLAQQGEQPVFWYRPRSDGFYEGPIHNAQIEQVRRESGAWVPLYAGAAPAAQQVVVKQSISYEDYWDAQIKTLMEEIGYPESNSVYAAMKRFQMRIESYEVKL